MNNYIRLTAVKGKEKNPSFFVRKDAILSIVPSDNMGSMLVIKNINILVEVEEGYGQILPMLGESVD